MDPVSFAIAAAPLAIYLVWLSLINLRWRPYLISGLCDVAWLAVAVSGLVVVGPLNLFVPDAAVARFGPYVWALLVAFYVLCVVLYGLVARPRLVIFNAPTERVWPAIEQVANRLDAGAKIAGHAVELPNASVQFHLDAAAAMRTITLRATGDKQSHTGWTRLKRELAAALRGVQVSPNPRGFTLLACALALVAWPAAQLLRMPGHLLAQRLMDMLRM